MLFRVQYERHMYGIQAGRATECLKPGVTLKLNELLRQGLITKTPDPNDKRKNYLTVNEEAIPQYKVFRRQDSEAIKRITDRYTMEEIGKFCEILDIISEINFEEINGA